MLLDEDSSHTARASLALTEELRIEFLWLPKRCLELNGLERLWGHGKDRICANWQESDIDAQVQRYIAYLSSLPNREALYQAGLRSEDWWLKGVYTFNLSPA